MIARVETEMRRKQYAMYRLRIAMKRLMCADCERERVMARRWVNAWGGAIGERWYAGRLPASSAYAAMTMPKRSGDVRPT